MVNYYSKNILLLEILLKFEYNNYSFNMKKLSFIILLAVLSFTSLAQSKTNLNAGATNWQNAILRADGKTEMDGIEAYCMKTTCEGEDFILIKFINKNEYKVVVQWVDAIFINGVWYYPQNQNPVKIQLDAKNTLAGQCEVAGKLKVKISSIINNPKDFQHYTVSGLEIIK